MTTTENNVPVADTDNGGQAEQGFSIEEIQFLNRYFERQSESVKQSIGVMLSPSDDPLHYLSRQSEIMKSLLKRLGLPWDKYLPILYKGFALYVVEVKGRDAQKKAIELTTEFLAFFAYVSQLGRFVEGMSEHYRRQMREIEALVAENERLAKVQDETESC